MLHMPAIRENMRLGLGSDTETECLSGSGPRGLILSWFQRENYNPSHSLLCRTAVVFVLLETAVQHQKTDRRDKLLETTETQTFC